MNLTNRPYDYNTGFWCAVASAILASLNAVVLVVYTFWLRGTAWQDNRRVQVQGRHFVVSPSRRSAPSQPPKASHADDERQLSELFLFWIIAIWAFIFSRIENWEYFNAIYFCVVTTLTVGFGDCEYLLLVGRADQLADWKVRNSLLLEPHAYTNLPTLPSMHLHHPLR